MVNREQTAAEKSEQSEHIGNSYPKFTIQTFKEKYNKIIEEINNNPNLRDTIGINIKADIEKSNDLDEDINGFATIFSQSESLRLRSNIDLDTWIKFSANSKLWKDLDTSRTSQFCFTCTQEIKLKSEVMKLVELEANFEKLFRKASVCICIMMNGTLLPLGMLALMGQVISGDNLPDMTCPYANSSTVPSGQFSLDENGRPAGFFPDRPAPKKTCCVIC